MQYLESAKRQFTMYRHLGEKAMAQVSDEALQWQPGSESNSIAVIVRHMAGNMLSRWTDFLTTDGEKPWRNRDGEFTDGFTGREALLEEWAKGWDCLFAALGSITDDDLERIVYIRNDGHTILEAINRQIAHYSYHVGQIIYIAKMHAQDGWQTLSIARNKSGDYNNAKFAQEKERRDFSSDLLK